MNAYYAMINGKEQQVRKSNHVYAVACLALRMFGKTREELTKRIYTEMRGGANHWQKWE